MKKDLIALFFCGVGCALLGYLFGYQQNELNHLSKQIHDVNMAKIKEVK